MDYCDEPDTISSHDPFFPLTHGHCYSITLPFDINNSKTLDVVVVPLEHGGKAIEWLTGGGQAKLIGMDVEFDGEHPRLMQLSAKERCVLLRFPSPTSPPSPLRSCEQLETLLLDTQVVKVGAALFVVSVPSPSSASFSLTLSLFPSSFFCYIMFSSFQDVIALYRHHRLLTNGVFELQTDGLLPVGLADMFSSAYKCSWEKDVVDHNDWGVYHLSNSQAILFSSFCGAGVLVLSLFSSSEQLFNR